MSSASADDNNGNGRVSFTTKELLQRLDEKLDRIDEKLDEKADRRSVHDLVNRTAALELVAVNRDGPIIKELKAFEITTGNRLVALEKQNELNLLVETRRDKGLSRWDARVAIGSAVISAGSVVYLLVH